MYMKIHMLAALREEFDEWERVLAGLSEEQIHAVPAPGELSLKDELAHLWAWQQRSIARMKAGQTNTEPQMPAWLSDVSPEAEENTDVINDWIYNRYKERPWSEVYTQWQSGFLQLMELIEAIPEPALLDSSRFTWLNGYSLADVILGTYDHHQEHMDHLQKQLQQESLK